MFSLSVHSRRDSFTYLLSSSRLTGFSLPKSVHHSVLTERVPISLMSSVVAPEKSTSNTMGPKEVSVTMSNSDCLRKIMQIKKKC